MIMKVISIDGNRAGGRVDLDFPKASKALED